ncbi:MAG: polymerase sigma factor, sigma-70 family [Phycisphaerales bacterium]|nr:polymerase sigma factor, sigma-70 family [Phycisphaerales bacterium]
MTNCFSRRGLTCAALLTIGLFATRATAADEPAVKPFLLRSIDASTKQPIPNVNVKFNIDNGKMVRTATDAEGKLTFVIPTNAKYVYVGLSDTAHVPVAFQFRPAQEAGEDHYDAPMPIAVPINGRVQDEAGEAIAGATVTFQLNTPREPAWPHMRLALSNERVVTDADGHWSFDQTPEDLSTLMLGVYHPQYVTNNGNEAYYNYDKVENPAALRDGSHVVTLKRGVLISGRVVDAEGKPVTKATVAIGRDRMPSNIVPPVKVDADGKFTLPGVAGQPITITAIAKGLAPDLQTFTVKDPPEELTFKLGPPQTLSGRVVDASGKPIRGVGVAIDTWRGARTIQKRMSTNADGKFTWTEAPADEVLVDVFDQSHSDQLNISMTAGKENVEKLTSPLTIAGTVVDDVTGQPVPKFTVLRGIKFNEQNVSWQRGQYEMAESAGTNGAFTREFSYPYPGNLIRIEAPGYLPADSPAYPTSAGSVTFEFRLKHGTDVAATVKGPDGKPVANADVVLVLPGNPMQFQNGRMTEYNNQFPQTKTNADGKFSFPPQTGEYLVAVVSDVGYGQISADKLKDATATVTLEPWAKIEGQAFIGSNAAADATIDVDLSRYLTGDWQKHPQIWGRNEAKADAEGRFTIDRVMAGAEIRVGRRLQLSSNSSTSVSSQKVSVKPGETAKVRIGGVGRPVVGSIKLPDELAGQRWGWSNIGLSSKQPTPELPKGFDKMTPEERRKRFEEWRKTDEGKAILANIFGGSKRSAVEAKYFNLALSDDGTFHGDDIEPGTYNLNINLQKPSVDNRNPMAEAMAFANVEVTVPPVPGGQSDEPITVPVVQMKSAHPFAVAPATQPAK